MTMSSPPRSNLSRPGLPRLYLVARLPSGIDHFGASNDIEPALPGLRLISSTRRHIMIADLDAAGVAQAHVITMIGWIMATMPPFAFRVIFDQIVASARHSLLKTSDALLGALECQAHVLEIARHYGLELPAKAAPVPHVTLGYQHRARARSSSQSALTPATTPAIAAPGISPMDGIGWLVEELVLVRSWHGRSWHEELDRWHLPERRKAA